LELAEAEEEKVDNMRFVDLWEQIETLERRVEVQKFHIQQVKLEVDEGEFQVEEQVEEARHIPAGKMAEVKLPQEEVEK
jgi:hypothetical protein